MRSWALARCTFLRLRPRFSSWTMTSPTFLLSPILNFLKLSHYYLSDSIHRLIKHYLHIINNIFRLKLPLLAFRLLSHTEHFAKNILKIHAASSSLVRTSKLIENIFKTSVLPIVLWCLSLSSLIIYVSLILIRKNLVCTKITIFLLTDLCKFIFWLRPWVFIRMMLLR